MEQADETPRFSEITISHYKNLKEARMALGSLSVLVGRNNSGKSNFFEVVPLLRDFCLKGQEGKQSIVRRLTGLSRWLNADVEATAIALSYSIGRAKERIDASYFVEFRASDDKLIVEREHLHYKSASATGPQKKLFERERSSLGLRAESGKGKAAFRSHPIALDASALEIIPSLYSEAEGPSDGFRELTGPILRLTDAPVFKTHGFSSNYQQEIDHTLPLLHEMEEKRDPRLKLFKDSFCEILEVDALSVKRVTLPSAKERSFYFCLVKERYRQDPTFIGDMSDGTRVLFLMLYHLFVSPSPIVFIDEPEIGLHPNAISRLLGLFHSRSVRKQVVMATHSAFLLNLLDANDVTLAEPDEDGLSTFRPVSRIEDLQKRLKSKYVSFGDLFADNFRTRVDTAL